MRILELLSIHIQHVLNTPANPKALHEHKTTLPHVPHMPTTCGHHTVPYLAMLMIQVQSTPCIINRAVLASLDTEPQLCLCQVAQRSGLGFLTLAD